MNDPPPQPPRLTAPEERVLALMSGLADGRRHTLTEVARRLGVSEERIVQILQSAKRKLGPPPS